MHHDLSTDLSALSLRDLLILQGDPDVDAGQELDSAYPARGCSALLGADELRHIFDLILFVHPDFQGASTHDWLDCFWDRHLRSTKRLLLVCKHWHAIALPYLYREVALRRVGQLPALVRTIRSAPQLFGPLIGSLRLLFNVPPAYVDLTFKGLRYLLATCTSLRKLAFEEAFVLRVGVELRWDNTDITEVFKDAAGALPQFPYLCQTLQELTFVNQWSYDQSCHDPICVPSGLIASCFNLSKLSVNALNVDNNGKNQPVTLPALVDLTIYCCTNTLNRMPVEWNMPNLRQVRLRDRFWSQRTHRLQIPNLMQFFEQARQELTHVDFGCSNMTWSLLVHIVDKCPNLCHLALAAPQAWSDDLLKMRRVKYVDLFMKQDARGHIHWRSALAADVADHLAHMWPKIRALDRSLLLAIPNLPIYFPPDELVLKQREHDFCGHVIVRTKDTVFQKAIHIDDRASFWSVEDLEAATRSEASDLEDHMSDLSDAESEAMAVDDTEQPESGDSDEEMELEADIEAMNAEMLEWSKYMFFEHGAEREAYPQINEDEALHIFFETVNA